ncbi:T9SS type B sorting domain-containing protein [Winogradskyella maritima]|uniref:T9SS type B sorting domain-containing protein n=1 Tax=Winogradskyella maritima TaxID=1517766 RepID=A0ABV8ADC1_9FLAO|nr:T9SS type B sorting domain-containing protein [Winogradskyella maritima]
MRLIYVFLLLCSFSFSQNEANHWYFGEFAGLRFTGAENPSILLDGELNTGEGCATISDTNGDLLFYTDGITVFNKNHNVMENGNDLNGNYTSTNSAIIIPKPNSENIYYIFTTDAQGGPNGLQYTEVDMSLDSGLGAVTDDKNIMLFTPISEKLSAIQNSSSTGYWVVAHKYGNNHFLSYRISSNGVDTIPVVSTVGSPINVTGDGFTTLGQMKITPDGRKLVMGIPNSSFELYDFNNENGSISNSVSIGFFHPTSNQLVTQPYGFEFSPDGKLLYVSSGSGIFQFDITTTAGILDSQYTVKLNTDSTFGYGGLQLAPNGKIYVSEWDNSFLHVINSPNNLQENCNYEEDGLYLGGRKSLLGLPPFIQSFFYSGFQADNTCEGEITLFNANIGEPYDSILWDFGDGNTSTTENPTHFYDTSGNYEVTLSINSNGNTYNQSRIVTVNEIPIVESIVELSQCDNDLDGISSFNLNEASSLISINHENENITFYETLIDAENKTNIITNISAYTNEIPSIDVVFARIENDNFCFSTSIVNLLVSTTQIPENFLINLYSCDEGSNENLGIASFNLNSTIVDIKNLFPTEQELSITFYRNIPDALLESNTIINTSNYRNINSPNVEYIYVRVENSIDNSCLGVGRHIKLNVLDNPVFEELPEQIFICSNSTIDLIADQGYDSYLWSTGDATQILNVDQAGDFTLTASLIYDDVACVTVKTVTVFESETPIISDIDIVDWTNNNNIITVLTQNNGDFEYSIDGINYQDENYFNNLQAGAYIVFVRDKNNCGLVSKDVFLLNFPRFFTPNGDGVNDFWQLNNATQEPLNIIYIFNRFGMLITELSANQRGWDGTFNGKKLPTADYWFILERQNGLTYTGHFTLKR